MELKNIKIVSCPCLFWCGMDKGTKTEQRLTISATGRVWFTQMVNGEDNTNVVGEKKQLSIGKEAAKHILHTMDEYFEHTLIEWLHPVLDGGIWGVRMEYTDGTVKKISGSLDADCYDEIQALSASVRKHIPIDGLWLLEEIKAE